MRASLPISFERIHLISILWSFIAAKCFLLEYWVQFHSVPINSALFVWLPSFGMGICATSVFIARMDKNELLLLLSDHVSLSWLLLSAISLILMTTKLVAGDASLEIAEWLIAFLLSIAYLFHGISHSSILRVLIGVCWLVAAKFIYTSPPPENALRLALCLVTLSALPELWNYWKEKPHKRSQS